MARLRQRLLLGLIALLSAASLASARTPDAARGAPLTPDRQILVFLRTPPGHLRPGADYSGGGYGDGQGRAARLRIAARLARAHGAAIVDAWPVPLLGVDCFVMAVPEGQSVDAAATGLARDPAVSWSEPMHTYHGQGAPLSHNDPLYSAQPAAREWRLADLHRMATGRNVRVAVVDSMIDSAHPDLAGQVEVSQNFAAGRPLSPERHGTAVAGVIAARADNGVGIAGVAPRARLMGLRACWQDAAGATTCDSLSLARALDYAINHKAQIINMSLSGPPDRLLGQLLDLAMARGATVIGAFDRQLQGGGFPASHPGVVAVVDETAAPPPAGVYAAPGRDIPATEPGGRWLLVSGSSYAAAHVSGLFALMRERAPRALKVSALVIDRSGDMIDACATLLQMSVPCSCGCAR